MPRLLPILLLLAAAIAAAQSPALPPFDALSVKPNVATDGGSISPNLPGQFRIINVPLHFILLTTFNVREHEMIGSPAWAREERFDITARYAADAVPLTESRRMVEKALVERFGLKTHRETREIPVYRLVMARPDRRLGPRLTASTVDCEQWFAAKKAQIGAGSPSPVAPGGRRPMCLQLPNRRFITAGAQPIAVLARALESMTARFVIDETGLAGNFDYDLEFAPTIEAGGTPTPGDSAPSIFTALQEQLGLKLESDRRPVPVVVIDAVSRPTPD